MNELRAKKEKASWNVSISATRKQAGNALVSFPVIEKLASSEVTNHGFIYHHGFKHLTRRK